MKWWAQNVLLSRCIEHDYHPHLHGFIPQMYVQASLMLGLTAEHLLFLQLTIDMYSFPVRVEHYYLYNFVNFCIVKHTWTHFQSVGKILSLGSCLTIVIKCKPEIISSDAWSKTTGHVTSGRCWRCWGWRWCGWWWTLKERNMLNETYYNISKYTYKMITSLWTRCSSTFKTSTASSLFYFDSSIVSPFCSPRVLDQPIRYSIFSTPTNCNHSMIRLRAFK